MSGSVHAQAAIGDGAGGFVIEEVVVRAPLAGEVRVALRAAGICHTRRHPGRAAGRCWPHHRHRPSVVRTAARDRSGRDAWPGDAARRPAARPVRLATAVRALTNGRGADHAFEATGVAALAFLPLKLCRNGGNAVQLSGAHGMVSVDMPQFWWDKRYLVPLYGGCQPEHDLPRLFDWAERGELALDSMVTHTYRLDQLQRALDDLLAGRSAKGVILFDET